MANHRVTLGNWCDVEVQRGGSLKIEIGHDFSGGELGREQARELALAILKAHEIPRVPGKGPLASAAELRPPDFDSLSASERWAIDKALGILDWTGSPDT